MARCVTGVCMARCVTGVCMAIVCDESVHG